MSKWSELLKKLTSPPEKVSKAFSEEYNPRLAYLLSDSDDNVEIQAVLRNYPEIKEEILDTGGEQLLKEVTDNANEAVSILDNSILPSNVNLSRGGDYSSELKVGDVITGKGTGSLTTDPDTAIRFSKGRKDPTVFNFTTGDKTPGAVQSPNMAGEQEMVIPPGLRFQVDSIQGDRPTGRLVQMSETNKEATPNRKKFYQALAMAGGASALDPSSAEASTPSIKDILQDVLAAKTSPSDYERLYSPSDPTIGTFLNPSGYPKSTKPPAEETPKDDTPSILDMIRGATGDLSGVLSSGQGFPSAIGDYAKGISMLKGFGPFAAAELAGMAGDAVLNTDTVRQLLNGKNLSDQYDEQAQVKVKNVLDPLIANGTLSPEISNSLAPKLRAYFREREDPNRELRIRMDEQTK